MCRCVCVTCNEITHTKKSGANTHNERNNKTYLEICQMFEGIRHLIIQSPLCAERKLKTYIVAGTYVFILTCSYTWTQSFAGNI